MQDINMSSIKTKNTQKLFDNNTTFETSNKRLSENNTSLIAKHALSMNDSLKKKKRHIYQCRYHTCSMVTYHFGTQTHRHVSHKSYESVRDNAVSHS